MKKLVNSIVGLVPNTKKKVTINLDGRNLIIVGENGCGKTSFLKDVYEKLTNNITNDGILKTNSLIEQISHFKNHIESIKNDPINKRNSERHLSRLENELSSIVNGVKIEYNDPDYYIDLKNRKLSSIRFFEAHRRAQITNATSASGITPDI